MNTTVSFDSLWSKEEKNEILNLIQSIRPTICNLVTLSASDTTVTAETSVQLVEETDNLVRFINGAMSGVAKSHGFLYLLSYSIKYIRSVVLSLLDSTEDALPAIFNTIHDLSEDFLQVINKICNIESVYNVKKSNDIIKLVREYQDYLEQLLNLQQTLEYSQFTSLSSDLICSLFPIISTLQLPPFSLQMEDQFSELYHTSAVMVSNIACILWRPEIPCTEAIRNAKQNVSIILNTIMDSVKNNINNKVQAILDKMPRVPVRPGLPVGRSPAHQSMEDIKPPSGLVSRPRTKIPGGAPPQPPSREEVAKPLSESSSTIPRVYSTRPIPPSPVTTTTTGGSGVVVKRSVTTKPESVNSTPPRLPARDVTSRGHSYSKSASQLPVTLRKETIPLVVNQHTKRREPLAALAPPVSRVISPRSSQNGSEEQDSPTPNTVKTMGSPSESENGTDLIDNQPVLNLDTESLAIVEDLLSEFAMFSWFADQWPRQSSIFKSQCLHDIASIVTPKSKQNC